MKKLGVDLGEHYLGHSTAREMTLSLSYTVQMQFKTLIQDSNSLISLMVDESTDNSNESKLLLLLRYCHESLEPKIFSFN